ncbi:catalytic activity protein [[Candida] boidinii]|nr:catalytic activity protein [[Candida] boidinii]
MVSSGSADQIETKPSSNQLQFSLQVPNNSSSQMQMRSRSLVNNNSSSDERGRSRASSRDASLSRDPSRAASKQNSTARSRSRLTSRSRGAVSRSRATHLQRDLSPVSPHLTGLHTLTKSLTHSGLGKNEVTPEVAAVPEYRSVHLNFVADEFKPIDPKSALVAKKIKDKATGRTSIILTTKRQTQDTTDKDKDDKNSKIKITDINTSTDLNNNNTDSSKKFKTRVSFDTVNVEYCAYPPEYSSSKCDDPDSIRSTRSDRILKPRELSPTSLLAAQASSGRGRSPSPFRDQSPSSRSLSPSDRGLSPVQSSSGSTRNSIVNDAKRRGYPTTPIITHESCTLNKTHQEFYSLYNNTSKKRAKLPGRSVLVYISGRRHTWVAIDWCVNRLLEDGDSLIVIASINPDDDPVIREFSRGSIFGTNNTKESIAKSQDQFKSLITDEMIRSSPEYAKIVSENIMKYILAITNPNKIIKVTIELGVGDTKDVLKDMIGLYLPGMIVTSAKPTKASSTRSWLTSRITDRLVKNFPLPVVVVPAMNMNLFEEKLFDIVEKRMMVLQKSQHEDKEILNELDLAGEINTRIAGLKLKQHFVENNSSDLDSENSSIFSFDSEEEEEEDSEDEDKKGSKKNDHDDHNKLTVKPFEASSDNNELTKQKSTISTKSRASRMSRISRSSRMTYGTDDDAYSDDGVKSFNPSISLDTSKKKKTNSHFKGSYCDDNNSLNSTDTTDSVKQVNMATVSAQMKLLEEMTEIRSKPIDENTFKDLLGAVSTAGYRVGIKLADVARLGGAGAELVRTLTLAPDPKYYTKKKSMLLDDGPEINISKTSSFRTSDSLFNSSSPYGFSTNGSTKGKLKSDINYSGISSAPRLQSALKFEDPKKNGIPGLHTNNLSPTSSGVSKNKISRPQLTTSKSAGSILTNQKDKEKKKKKGFFKSIFS